MWVFRLSGALVFAVFGEGVTRSCHPERGRAPIRFLQDGKPESKDLGFVLPPPAAPPFAVLWRRWIYCCAAMSPSRCFAPRVASHDGTTGTAESHRQFSSSRRAPAARRRPR